MYGETELAESLQNLGLDDSPVIHDKSECTIVHPNSQTQTIEDCWCRLYHIFSNETIFEHVTEVEVRPKIFCLMLNQISSLFAKMPQNPLMLQKFGIHTNGPVVFYKKGYPMTVEMTKQVFSS